MGTTFAELQINADAIKILDSMEIYEPTPIQEQAIPAIMNGKDVIALSQTGTGKTLAYLLPALNRIDPAVKSLQVLIIVPTRELGMQIVRETEKFVGGSGIVVQGLIGGTSLSRQMEKLRMHPQLVIGTPGRILELCKSRKMKTHLIRTLIVDEADQVFGLGSQDEVEDIIKSAPRDRQIVFLSATIPKAIGQMALRWMKEPVSIEILSGQRTSDTLEHMYFVCDERDKIDILRKLVRMFNPHSALVFINQINSAAELVAKLQYAQLSIEALHGEADKQERAAVLSGFRAGKFQLLLATDVAARGLDIKKLSHVINYDLPEDADHYLHRVGRTGRMGQHGTAISLVTNKEMYLINKFEKSLGIHIAPKAMFKGRLIENGRAEPHPKLGKKPSHAAAVSKPKGRPPQKDRLIDRKNKGAPKWMTSKDNPGGT